VDLGVELDLIQKSGAWFSYHDQKIGQGRENVKKYLEDNPLVMEEIALAIRQKLGMK
jgi:recombination protein RecA